MNEGWTYLINSPRWHYFINGTSLCGRWMTFAPASELQQGNDNSPENCKACQKKLAKRQRANTTTSATQEATPCD